LAITETRVAKLKHFDAWPLIQTLRAGQEIRVQVEEVDDLLAELTTMPHLPRLEIPQEFAVQQARPIPVRRVTLKRQRGPYAVSDCLAAKVTFEYEGHAFDDSDHVDARLDS